MDFTACTSNIRTCVLRRGSHLIFLLPEEVQGDIFHPTVVAQLAPKHFLEHADEVDVVLCLHCIVMIEVQKHHLNQEPLSVCLPTICSSFNHCGLLTSFLCLQRKELISNRPSLTFADKWGEISYGSSLK